MRYDVRLTLGTTYGSPAGAGRHLARVRPRDLPGLQRVERLSVRVVPDPEERWAHEDFFANAADGFAIRRAHARVAVTMRARVERLAAPAPDGAATLPRLAEALAASRDLGPLSPLHFLAPSPYVPREPEVAAWARATAEGPDAFATAWSLSRAVHDGWTYDGEATDLDTPVIEAFRARRGVCQDFAHVLIGALRSLGIPAGYCSGLIRTVPPPGRPRLEGADAMHAWVMAWCGGGAGWVELDPTNDRLAGEDHVLVARGRDYADVAPLKGVLRLAGGQEAEQAVDVVPV